MEELERLGDIAVTNWKKFAEQSEPPEPIRKNYSPLLYKIVTISPKSYQSDWLDSEALQGRLEDDAASAPDGASPLPTLKLVVIPRDEVDKLLIPEQLFFDTCRCFNIDPVLRHHIFLSSYGFHYYHAGSESTRFCFYFGSYLYSLAWTFDPATGSTTAIMILRTIERLYWGRLALDSFEGCLKIYRSRIHTPFFLAFAAFVHFAYVMDDNLCRVSADIRGIENLTEHGPFDRGKSHRPDQVDLEKLTRGSRKLSDAQVHLGNMLRHTKILVEMAALLDDQKFLEPWRPTGQRLEDQDYFARVLPIGKRRLDAAKWSIGYLQDRARGQSNVIFALLTHDDATLHLGEASRGTEIAEAAKKDSAAMKTIAVMTMLFLPGTFFAALFALPVLKWDEDQIIHHGFGLYWAFTIPATIFVFTAATLLNWYGDKIKAKLRPYHATPTPSIKMQNSRQESLVSYSSSTMYRRNGSTV